MVEENQQLATRIDGDLQTAQDQVTALRQDLQDTKSKINQFQQSPSPSVVPTNSTSSSNNTPTKSINHSKIPSSTNSSARLTNSSPKLGSSSKIPINVSKSFPGVSEAVGHKERSLSADGRRKSKPDENGDASRDDSDNSSGSMYIL